MWSTHLKQNVNSLYHTGNKFVGGITLPIPEALQDKHGRLNGTDCKHANGFPEGTLKIILEDIKPLMDGNKRFSWKS